MSNDFFISIPLNNNNEPEHFGFINSLLLKNRQGSIFFWGDCINQSQLNDFPSLTAHLIHDHLKGHFIYLALLNHQILIGNSAFSILPVYYAIENQSLFISNKAILIAEKLQNKTFNKRFVLENILFNYQLFNETFYKEIKLLPSNSYIKVENNKFTILHLKPIEDYFLSQPKPWKKSVESISEFFIEKSAIYFPNEEFAASLTGGFDGRTLVSLAKFHQNQFSTYSFGAQDSSDFKVAKSLSTKLGINFIPFDLDDVYSENSLKFGLDFIENCEGNGGFARAHYLYATKSLSKNYKYIITGNFGSEVFRAAHIAGIVISPNLYQIFNSMNVNEAIIKIKNSNSFKYLNNSQFSEEWESLKSDIAKLPIFDIKYAHFDLNQKFYKFVFEEVFRKYFGAELINQYKHITNRTPFLDFDFIKEILKTELSGVYSDFFTNNPLKRYKGQMVYGHILKKTNQVLFTEYTDKGYRPSDLLSLKGKLNITRSFVKKKLFKANSPIDPYGVQTAFLKNFNFWDSLTDNLGLFNMELIKSKIDEKHLSDSLGIVLSQLWYTNKINQK